MDNESKSILLGVIITVTFLLGIIAGILIERRDNKERLKELSTYTQVERTDKLIKREIRYVPITLTFKSSSGFTHFSTISCIRIKEYRIITH